MTDTYIWQKVRQRFLDIDGKLKDNEGNDTDTDIITKEYDSEGNVIAYTNVVEPNEIQARETLASKDGIWFEIFPLHSQPYQQELGATGRNRWIFGLQVNINSPRDTGTYDIDSVYDAIAAQFKRGDIFDGIRVTQTAYRSSARMLDDYYSEPVTAMLQADLDND